MIEFKNVTKKYKTGQEALSNVNLHIAKNELVFLTGHSGAGKSTLLKLIILLEKVTAGQIIVNEQKLKSLRKKQVPYLRRNIGVVFQDPQLLQKRTVFENVSLPLIVSGARNKDIAKRTRAALDMVGLLDKEKRCTLAMSTGEQQRVGIARAIVTKPKILLADEPTGNLDPQLSAEIMHLLERLNQSGTTMLIASHDLALITSLNHRVLTLQNGACIADV